MIKVKVICGTTYGCCPSETFELECADMKEFDSDAFSNEILCEILDGVCPHYFINIETEEVDDEDEDDEDD